MFPVSQFEGLTDDDMSGQVAGDSLQFSMDLGDLDPAMDASQDASGRQIDADYVILNIPNPKIELLRSTIKPFTRKATICLLAWV